MTQHHSSLDTFTRNNWKMNQYLYHYLTRLKLEINIHAWQLTTFIFLKLIGILACEDPKKFWKWSPGEVSQIQVTFLNVESVIEEYVIAITSLIFGSGKIRDDYEQLLLLCCTPPLDIQS